MSLRAAGAKGVPRNDRYFMDIQDLLTTAKEQTFDRFAVKLNALVREHSQFRNLDEANRKVLLDIIKKHLQSIHHGVGLSALTIREEMYHLYEKRIKLNLVESDLKDIKEILELFKK